MSQKSLIIKLLSRQAELLQKDLTAEDAYLQWKRSDDYLEYSEYLSRDELNSIFPSPTFPNPSLMEKDEHGAPIDYKEFSPESGDVRLKDFPRLGWLTEGIAGKLVNSEYYQKIVYPGIGDLPEPVKRSIQDHALHVLSRCNNPNDWETTSEPYTRIDSWEIKNGSFNDSTYWDNKQGLVYGMVQSGKTANMLTLMGLAITAGYDLLILLSGDKTSLRDQTQLRINHAFGLNSVGMPSQSSNRVRSITRPNEDYADSTRNSQSGIDVFREYIIDQHKIIICIKKETSNLSKLVQHIRDLRSNEEHIHNFNFASDLKALIIDDEADYASQNNRRDGSSTIHDLICQLRESLPNNTYVAYTATPQACLGANPNALVGYPRDFIWLLDPHRNEDGFTSSYMGLQEFFNTYKNDIIELIPDESWPSWKKINGRKLGIQDIHGNIVTDRLTDIERDTLKEFNDNQNLRNSNCKIYKQAIVHFLISTATKWYRHWKKHPITGNGDTKPSTSEINDIETIGSNNGNKVYPYQAMMFNLAYITETHYELQKLLIKLFEDVVKEFNTTKISNWSCESLFTQMYKKQKHKSDRFERSIPEAKELEHFIELAIQITKSPIHSEDNITDEESYIYVLNSADEGQTLQYNTANPILRPKKCSIIIGGHILGRGLTIEGLTTSVFIRSQSQSLGDTNLQMCRWFGHKKKDIDIQTLYIQEHSLELFEDITYADNELRSNFREYTYKGAPAECILIELQNSPLFKVTSPTKSRFLEKTDRLSYGGRTVDLMEPMSHDEYHKNYPILQEFISNLGKNGEFVHDRATLFRNIQIDQVITLLQRLKIGKEAMLITPQQYIEYISDWREHSEYLPDVNIAIFGTKENYLNRKRSKGGTYRSFKGGKSHGQYLGDVFIDKSNSFHARYKNERGLKRTPEDNILINFYLLNSGYVDSSTPPSDIENGQNKTPIVTYSISTPPSGPKYRVQVNADIRDRKVINEDKCKEWEEKYLAYNEN